jgi:uncharacterized protein (DUF4415 family)
MPSQKEQTAFRIDREVMDALRQIRERDGILISEQVRRALAAWVAAKNVAPPAATRTARKRAATR